MNEEIPNKSIFAHYYFIRNMTFGNETHTKNSQTHTRSTLSTLTDTKNVNKNRLIKSNESSMLLSNIHTVKLITTRAAEPLIRLHLGQINAVCMVYDGNVIPYTLSNCVNVNHNI